VHSRILPLIYHRFPSPERGDFSRISGIVKLMKIGLLYRNWLVEIGIVTTHPHQEAEVFVFLTVCGIGDSPIGIVVVWLIAKKDFTMIYISKYVINIELYLRKS
jgi:hypothetical protein